MEDQDTWNEFASSGKITDYLRYCRACSTIDVEESNRKETADEGSSHSDRYGADCINDQRIR